MNQKMPFLEKLDRLCFKSLVRCETLFDGDAARYEYIAPENPKSILDYPNLFVRSALAVMELSVLGLLVYLAVANSNTTKSKQQDKATVVKEYVQPIQQKQVMKFKERQI